MKISVFYIPTGSEDEARSLGKLAIENKLAACANVHPIQSFYPWEGKLQQENEFVLLLKTLPALNSALQTFIENHHSYKVPCIMHWESEVNNTYGEWISSTITKK